MGDPARKQNPYPRGEGLPAEVRAKLGLPPKGPLPRALRLAPCLAEADHGLSIILPTAIAIIVKIAENYEEDGRTAFQAARYLVDRTMGAPATSTKAPAEDMSPPLDGVDPYVATALEAFKGLGDQALTRIKNIMLDDLRRQGKIPADQPDEVVVDVDVKPTSPTTSSTPTQGSE